VQDINRVDTVLKKMDGMGETEMKKKILIKIK